MTFSMVARVALLLSLGPVLAAQAPPNGEGKPTPPTISDNSFLVEEAYNQEAGVVQHILTYRRTREREWELSFTQEWPMPSQRHQLSYTVAALSAPGQGTGVGDALLNYRYQAVGRDDERVWFSPRLSAILPTGSVRDGRGAGGPGMQVNLPVSVSLSDAVVTHWNAGATISRVRNAAGTRRTSRGANAAASAIWLLAPTFNLMLETAWDRSTSLDDSGQMTTADNLVVLPGLRGAFNLPSGMQIIPGLGVPIGVGPSRGSRDLFLYLSVEHSFR